MQTLKQFSKIIDYHTGLVTLLALVVVFLCRQLDFLVDLPTTLIGIAVVFPLVFSINSAYKRREDALRAYSRLFLNLFPLLFGPYFANIAYPEHPLAGYVVAVLYSLVLVSLDNIQDHLENPFDGLGADDLRLDVANEYGQLVNV